MEGARPVRAPRGTTLTARSWQTEAPLRMLQNNLDPEVAERPDDLVVYGGTGRAARDWRSFDAMVRTLTTLGDDETMLVQSGRPVGVLRTHEWAPRVLIANSNLVGDWATWPEFRRLEQLGLTMYGQMTAGSWIYIGTQGILQGTYETFAAVAAKRFGGTLRGHADRHRRLRRHGRRAAARGHPERRRLPGRRRRRGTAAAPGGAPLPRRAGRRPGRRRSPAAKPRRASGGRCRSGWSATAPTCCRSCCAAGCAIDIVTDQTSAHDPLSYLPERRRRRRLARLRRGQARGVHRPGAGVDGPARRGDGRVPGRAAPRCSTTATRSATRPARAATTGRSPSRGSCPAYIRPLFCEGKGPFRWAALSGDPADIAATDEAVLDLFPDDDHLQRWIRAAQERVAFQGLPARICWLGHGERDKAGLRFNEMVAVGRGVGADRHRPRPPRLRLGRLARTGRPRRWPTAPTRSPTGRCSTRWSNGVVRRDLGVDPPRRRGRHRPVASTPGR